MKFIVDAQLPRRIARALQTWGYDAIHTLDLPAGNTTSDFQIAQLADQEGRVVITKDSDFVDSFLLRAEPERLLLRAEPERLLLISTGNITNDELLSLLCKNLSEIERMFTQGVFVEISRQHLTLHQ
jgi:predicted nuclease of predicted toxin-antitoxin system